MRTRRKTLNNSPPRVQNIFLLQIYYFFDLKLFAKFQNPRTTPSGRKVYGTEKEKGNNSNIYKDDNDILTMLQ
jgi:hypothetical protein